MVLSHRDGKSHRDSETTPAKPSSSRPRNRHSEDQWFPARCPRFQFCVSFFHQTFSGGGEHHVRGMPEARLANSWRSISVSTRPLPRSVLLPGGHAQELDAFYCLGFLSNPTWGGGMNANGGRIAPFQTYRSDFKNLGSDLSIYHVLTSGSQVWKWQRAELGLDPRRDRPRTLTGVEASHLRRGLAHIFCDPFLLFSHPFF